jgi:hypothetical protein
MGIILIPRKEEEKEVNLGFGVYSGDFGWFL